jgi:hypothetical protein
MTLHFHGTPITPHARVLELAGRNFCVSYADPRQVETCHRIGQSVMLDNGAFTFWKQGVTTTPNWWKGYAEWAERWLDYRTSWAVIPDVIDGTVEENDLMIARWPRSLFGQSAPVWHMNEPIDRLRYLCLAWGKVCVGSSGAYREVGSPQWHRRMEAAFNAICKDGASPTWLHMLRGMVLVEGPYPFASVDSTDIARNHNRPQHTVRGMADRWDGLQCPPRWTFREQLELTA